MAALAADLGVGSPDTHRTEDAVTMRDKTDDVAGLSSVSPEGETHG